MALGQQHPRHSLQPSLKNPRVYPGPPDMTEVSALCSSCSVGEMASFLAMSRGPQERPLAIRSQRMLARQMWRNLCHDLVLLFWGECLVPNW